MESYHQELQKDTQKSTTNKRNIPLPHIQVSQMKAGKRKQGNKIREHKQKTNIKHQTQALMY